MILASDLSQMDVSSIAFLTLASFSALTRICLIKFYIYLNSAETWSPGTRTPLLKIVLATKKRKTHPFKQSGTWLSKTLESGLKYLKIGMSFIFSAISAQ